MAFCGVDTGSMNPNDAANVAARAGIIGSTAAVTASGMMIGTTTDAGAVFDVVSETTIASSAANTVSAYVLPDPSASAAVPPIVSARPVLASSEPRMMPVPKSTMVLQSMRCGLGPGERLKLNTVQQAASWCRRPGADCRTRGPVTDIKALKATSPGVVLEFVHLVGAA